MIGQTLLRAKSERGGAASVAFPVTASSVVRASATSNIVIRQLSEVVRCREPLD